MGQSWKCADPRCGVEGKPDMCLKCGQRGFVETHNRISIQSYILDLYIQEALPLAADVTAITRFATWFNNRKFEV